MSRSVTTGLSYSFMALLLSLTALAALIFAAFYITYSGKEEKAKMLFSLHSRAESLAWSLEGAARLAGKNHQFLAIAIAEMGRQPGIAWIALVDQSGRILLDSNMLLAGSLLYSPQELHSLRPDGHLQGRFSPDEPTIYETWQLFSPWRLAAAYQQRQQSQDILFVALNAANFEADLATYKFRLWLIAFFATFSLLCLLALLFYIRNNILSRNELLNLQSMAYQIIEAYPAALLVADINGKIITINNKAKAFINGASSLFEIPGQNWQQIIKNLNDGAEIFEAEIDFTSTNKEPIPILLQASSLLNHNGRQDGYLIVITDLSQRRLFQKQLEESERFSALGKLSAGLAHEIRNPLSSIRGYAAYLEEKLLHEPMAKTTASLLIEETERLNKITTELLNFAKRPVLQNECLDLADLLRHSVELMLPEVNSRKTEITISAPEDIKLFGDKDKLLQVLLNLLLNAMQAIGEKGKIQINARILPAGSASIPLELDRKDPCCQIQISDNGPGIARDIINQIFTPYFTTRSTGAGLGLSICRQVIEAHGGCIKAFSRPSEGATFLIYLPYRDKCEDADFDSR